MMMVLGKTLKRGVVIIRRWIKTLFILITMFISLLLFSAPPIFVSIADAILPSAFLSAALSPPPSSLNFQTHLNTYDFRRSLFDVPLISIIRSAIILCVYSLCDGPKLSRGPYLAVATVCSAASLVFVSLKAPYIFIISGGGGGDNSAYGKTMEAAVFVSSLGLAIGHVAVAYRTSCRERRKLLVYKIDIEAVSACKNNFPRYQKILQQARTK
ncbi:hypothetical protein ABFS82_06G137900 [Erythranthe guttata]|nr:PREDICTED: uncharacterized protein LOC105974872 [Erythranthe guttata]|eukprot:XP_012855485.1 PREDICTED: uncharacterized protein LOC105974872 [Erythranthe guttata]